MTLKSRECPGQVFKVERILQKKIEIQVFVTFFSLYKCFFGLQGLKTLIEWGIMHNCNVLGFL